jgi:hypothetical protein
MDNVTLNKNICRQVNDIIVKAEALKTCEYFESDFENFLNYNKELKSFIAQNTSNPEIIKTLNNVPTISIKKNTGISFYFFQEKMGCDIGKNTLKTIRVGT